jgi:hypothetical protein
MAWTTLARLAREGAIERVAHGVYRMRGAPADNHLGVRAAWLQLAPDTTVWERTPEQGVVSRRSAAAIYGFGHLPADIHQFALPVRRQSRRADVRLYIADLKDDEWIRLGGLLITRPARIAADLLGDREDPESIAHVIADALREAKDYPSAVAEAIAPHAFRFKLGNADGLALLEWLLDLTQDPQRAAWLAEARNALGSKDETADADGNRS